MQGLDLDRIADLLIEARGLVGDGHPPVLRLVVDIALFEVGRCIAATGEPLLADEPRTEAATVHGAYLHGPAIRSRPG